VTDLPAVHICVVQPLGYVHSLGFLDQARHFRYQFRRLGAEVSIAKNRLRHDAVNVVFGAHLGFDPALRKRYTCIFVNLEQLGIGGAPVSAAYLALLGGSAVADYDKANVSAYTTHVDDVCIVPMLHSPYLASEGLLPLEERPIDLLFFGSVNERRTRMIAQVEAQGLSVSLFDAPLYGAERDHFIRQAKAVLNFHFYESSRFEQARVSHCLSLGTPVIAERTARTQPPPCFDDAVFWVDEANLGNFIRTRFGKPEFFSEARRQLEVFAQTDGIEDYAELLAFACGYRKTQQQTMDPTPWQPRCVNLGSGKDYKSGWLNLDVIPSAEPDLLLDLGREIELPLRARSPYCGEVLLDRGSVDEIYANNVLEHVPDLPRLMSNCLALLRTGGQFHVEVPYEHANTAWQDPTHLRAMNENSWIYYTDWFWYLGWFEHRFEIAASTWLDIGLQPCQKDSAAFMRMVLRKVETTHRDRTTARAMAADVMLPEDSLDPVPLAAPASRAAAVTA
jgi:SAM-dependent methyltransferase